MKLTNTSLLCVLLCNTRPVLLIIAKHIITQQCHDSDGSGVSYVSSDGCGSDTVTHQINEEKNDFLMIVCEYLIKIVINGVCMRDDANGL